LNRFLELFILHKNIKIFYILSARSSLTNSAHINKYLVNPPVLSDSAW